MSSGAERRGYEGQFATNCEAKMLYGSSLSEYTEGMPIVTLMQN